MENGDLDSHPRAAPVVMGHAVEAGALLEAPSGHQPQTILEKEIPGAPLLPKPPTGSLLQEEATPPNNPSQGAPHPPDVLLRDPSIPLPPTSDPPELHLTQQQTEVSPKASAIQNMPAANTPANEAISVNSLLPDNTNDNTLVDDHTILEQLQPASQANNTGQRLVPDIGDGDPKLTRQRSATRPPLTLNTTSEALAFKDMDRRPPTGTPRIVIDLESESASPAIVPTPSSQHSHSAKEKRHTGKSVSALTTLLAAEKAHRSPTKKQRPAIQPYYHAFGNMGALYPTRSLSSNAIPTTTARRDSSTSSVVGSIAESPSESTNSQVASSPHDSDHQDPNHFHHFHRPHFHGLSKSLSMGKTGKTGFSARLKNLRQKHGPMSQEEFTSGESDSECMQDASLDSAANAPRRKIFDPTLPPPPMRLNSSASNSSLNTLQPPHTPTIGTPYGYGGMGVAPLSISTKFIGTSPGHHSASATDLTALRDKNLPRDSSTARLKGMLKRNVGLSSPALSTASLNSPQATTMGAGDVLDDLQPYQNRFSVSRLTGRTKRRELSRSRASGDDSRGTTLATSDDDDPPLTIPSRQHRYRHLFHRHDRLSAQRGTDGIGEKNASREEHIGNIYVPSVSQALQEARAVNNDPNLLLAELEPLPPKFVLAYATLKRKSSSPVPSVDTSIAAAGPGSMANKIISIPPLPVLMYAMPTVAPGSGYVVGGQGGVPGGRGSPGQKSAVTTTTTVTSGGVSSPSSVLRSAAVRGLVVPEKPVEPTPLCTKAFLFKSYQNSRPQGHYLFRIVQDRVEYGKLPVTKESCCSQYFRQADVTYRSLEKKYKLSKAAKHEMLVQHQQEWAERQRLSREESFQPSRATLDKNMTTVSEPVARRTSVVAFEGYETDDDHATTSTTTMTAKTTSSRATIHGESRGKEEKSSYVQESSLQPGSVRVLLSGRADSKGLSHDPEIDALFSTRQGLDTTQEANPEPGPARVLLSGRGDSKAMTQSPVLDTPSLAQQGPDDVDDTREGRKDSDPVTERSLTPELPPTPPPELTLTSPPEISLAPPLPPELSLTPPLGITPSPPLSTPLSTSEPRLSYVPPKKDSVTKLPILTYEQVWQEAQMQAVDDAYWYRLERDRCLEAAEVLYGLDLYLSEIAHHVEYERFETVAQTDILNENRDTTLFTIANGDRTNVMWLESPSLKLKNEFMSWFTIALMGRGEPEVACALADEPGKTHLDTLVESSTEPPTKGELKQRDGDTLIDLTTVQLTLLEKQIAEKRQQICDEIKQIEDALDHLDNLDMRTKSTATAMLNAIESQEVQMALQPSLTTGLTLAETVVLKLKEVDDRIVACTKIMRAARFNLNRLRYEIELEQRSIRHFRHYKIMIAVATLVVLTAVWVLF
ncbi:hypothetical protein BGZ81_006085 [Podila clonocystis]|nr:hypothetical protein BGZ81_006085 [Podila clonocystis]